MSLSEEKKKYLAYFNKLHAPHVQGNLYFIDLILCCKIKLN